MLFHEKHVLRNWDGEKELWYFSVLDVIAILTDEITKAWAGKSIKQYKAFKGLRKQNLKDLLRGK